MVPRLTCEVMVSRILERSVGVKCGRRVLERQRLVEVVTNVLLESGAVPPFETVDVALVVGGGLVVDSDVVEILESAERICAARAGDMVNLTDLVSALAGPVSQMHEDMARCRVSPEGERDCAASIQEVLELLAGGGGPMVAGVSESAVLTEVFLNDAGQRRPESGTLRKALVGIARSPTRADKSAVTLDELFDAVVGEPGSVAGSVVGGSDVIAMTPAPIAEPEVTTTVRRPFSASASQALKRASAMSPSSDITTTAHVVLAALELVEAGVDCDSLARLHRGGTSMNEIRRRLEECIAVDEER
jgi:hypothetical protein